MTLNVAKLWKLGLSLVPHQVIFVDASSDNIRRKACLVNAERSLPPTRSRKFFYQIKTKLFILKNSKICLDNRPDLRADHFPPRVSDQIPEISQALAAAELARDLIHSLLWAELLTG